MFDDEVKDDFLATEGFDANYFDKLDDQIAKEIMTSGKEISRFQDTGSTWWTLYLYKGIKYVGLCDFEDIWVLDDEMEEQIKGFL